MPKPMLGDKRVHAFPKGICPKVNVIAWLEFEPAYYEPAYYDLTITPRFFAYFKTTIVQVTSAKYNPRGVDMP